MMEKDPIVMYLVVRESLGMSPGKIGAQIGHAVQIFMMEYFPNKHRSLTEREYELHLLTREWLAREYGKIVLTASDSEFEKVKLENPNEFFSVIDNGHTEVPPGSETMLCFWPMHKSSRSKTLKRLQLLTRGFAVESSAGPDF
jgi:PTH2 family peptidyl-tRNA hydrolase